jgi:hypothetical protein
MILLFKMFCVVIVNDFFHQVNSIGFNLEFQWKFHGLMHGILMGMALWRALLPTSFEVSAEDAAFLKQFYDLCR